MPIDPAVGEPRPSAIRTRFLGLAYDRLEMRPLIDTIVQLARARGFAYMVTPNVDHIVRLHEQIRSGDADHLWRCYEKAALCVCDSRVLSALATLRGRKLPVVPGSDLLARLLTSDAVPGDTILLIGGDASALEKLKARFPDLIFDQHRPPMGLLQDPVGLDAATRYVIDNPAKYVLLAVGSPQQEVLADRIASSGAASGVGLCIGAAVDFIVGDERRAPGAMQAIGLEWLFRLLMNPKRLWRRYLVEGPKIFLLAARWRDPQGKPGKHVTWTP